MAAGVAITAVASRFLLQEPLTREIPGGIALITVGVLITEIDAEHQQPDRTLHQQEQ